MMRKFYLKIILKFSLFTIVELGFTYLVYYQLGKFDNSLYSGLNSFALLFGGLGGILLIASTLTTIAQYIFTELNIHDASKKIKPYKGTSFNFLHHFCQSFREKVQHFENPIQLDYLHLNKEESQALFSLSLNHLQKQFLEKQISLQGNLNYDDLTKLGELLTYEEKCQLEETIRLHQLYQQQQKLDNFFHNNEISYQYQQVDLSYPKKEKSESKEINLTHLL